MLPGSRSIGMARAVLRFGRLHTVIATSFQAVGIWVVALAGSPLSTDAWLLLLVTWLGSLLANQYVVGLNQLTDIDIDRVNKPDLPLARGDLTVQQGRWIVLSAGLLALFIGALQSVWLLGTFVVVMGIGTLYSLRPARFKERPVLAALSIAFARGVVANAGLYMHYTERLDLTAAGSDLWWLLPFFFGFGLVIALYKDIPDTEGDQTYAVRTFAVRLGQRRIFSIGRWLLSGILLIPAIAGVSRLPGADGLLLIGAHLVMIATFWILSLRTDPDVPASMMRLYLALWGIFYSEYLVLSLVAVTAGAP